MTPDRSGTAPEQASIAEQLTQSRKELLDLTLRNSLLNFRPSRTRGLKIIDEIPREVFRILVRDRRAMSLRPADTDAEAAPAPDDQEIPTALLSLMAAEDEPDRLADRHTDNRLQTPYDRTQLDVRLRNTFRFAHTSLEEQGVNILYLALGMLHWHESDSSQDPRRAPLILVPAELSRTDARTRFTLTFADEEIDANLSLNEKLKQDFDIRLPLLPDVEDIDVDEYLRRVADSVASQDRWSVDADAIHIGDACLELHSHKANKRAVLDELKRTLSLGKPRLSDPAEDRAQLRTDRTRLNDYCRLVNTPIGDSGVSPHDIVGRLAQLEESGPSRYPSIRLDGASQWSRAEFTWRRELVEALQGSISVIGPPGEHTFWISGCSSCTLTRQPAHSATPFTRCWTALSTERR